MRRWGVAVIVLLLVYLSTGFYILRGNEKGVLRRFGRLVMSEGGTVLLQPSGLYFDLPWPLTAVDRVNLNEVRTLTIGSPEMDNIAGEQFTEAVDPTRQSQFLSGDKNILNVQISVHYRIAEAHVDDFLFGSESSERRLQRSAESALADAVLRSGVDFVHTLGRTELRTILVTGIRELVSGLHLGVEVDDVTIGSVYPPIPVKAQFLDVMNARADRETYINEASAYAEQRQAEASAQASKLLDEADIYKQQMVEAARGKSDSFAKLIQQFRLEEQQGVQSYAEARAMALRRQYIEVVEGVLRRAAAKVLLDSGKPVDLTILRDPTE